MNKLIPLLLFIAVLFIGCDGRSRAKQTNTEVLKEHNLLDSFSEHTEYIPMEYTEVVFL